MRPAGRTPSEVKVFHAPDAGKPQSNSKGGGPYSSVSAFFHAFGPFLRVIRMHLADTKHAHSPYMPGVERWSLYRSLWNRYASEFIVSYSKRFGARWGELTAEKKGELKKLIE